jgi:hypothetical protein
MDKEQIVTQQQPDDDVHGRASHKQNTGLHTCILYGSGELAVGQREDDVIRNDVIGRQRPIRQVSQNVDIWRSRGSRFGGPGVPSSGPYGKPG